MPVRGAYSGAMKLVQEALRAGHSGSPLRRSQREPVLLLGGAGALGSAVLERMLSAAPVEVAVIGPLETGLQGLMPLPLVPTLAEPLLTRARLALLVFDVPRHANGRERSFYLPQPEQLPALGRALRAGGIEDLLIVLPHAPARLPQALKTGLASLDEQAVASLGFRHLLILRPSRDGVKLPAAASLQGVANWVLSQLRWMIPAPDLPMRPAKVAELTVQLALQLPRAAPGTRVAPPELVYAAAQTQDVAGLAADWLAGRDWQAAPLRSWRGGRS